MGILVPNLQSGMKEVSPRCTYQSSVVINRLNLAQVYIWAASDTIRVGLIVHSVFSTEINIIMCH